MLNSFVILAAIFNQSVDLRANWLL